jgi:hypothetical protein
LRYTLEDIKQLEVELELNSDVNFIDYVRELHLLKEQTQLFFTGLREIIFLAEDYYRKE